MNESEKKELNKLKEHDRILFNKIDNLLSFVEKSNNNEKNFPHSSFSPLKERIKKYIFIKNFIKYSSIFTLFLIILNFIFLKNFNEWTNFSKVMLSFIVYVINIYFEKLFFLLNKLFFFIASLFGNNLIIIGSILIFLIVIKFSLKIFIHEK